jgi:glycosyltransferase involved in cell wall biosynthesis
MILDTHDVMSSRTARFAEAGLKPLIAVNPEQEACALACFDTLLAIHCEEAVALRTLCPDRPVLTVGHPASTHPFKFREGEDLRVLFVAAAGAHNRHAIDAFLVQLWPRLRAELGQRVVCVIAGRVSEGISPGADGVALRGFVADMDALYAEADVVINPVTVGSGLKIKNVEALAYGKPLVTTSVGVEGLRDAVGRGIAVADEPEAMLKVLRHLLRDCSARRRCAEAAHAFARAKLSADMVYADLLSLLHGEHG